MSTTPLPRLLIIADDLSGAADCAADFAGRMVTQVILSHVGLELGTALGAEVIALDLDSRRLSAQAAAVAHRDVLAMDQVAELPLYKKIDSTLRGNVASEVAALQALRGMALVAPAFPLMGRTTVGGVQHLDGVPVDQTDVWRNERLAGTANLLEQLRTQGLRCATLSLDAVRDTERLQADLLRHLVAGVQALVCDAQTETDLANIAQASAALYKRLFWVGSAGLARHLPQALGFPPVSAQLNAPINGPVLTVVGSMSRHSQVQANYLAEHSDQLHLRLAPATLCAGPEMAEWQSIAATIETAQQQGRHVLVSLQQEQRDPGQAAQLSTALAQLLQPALLRSGALIATGGETARAMLGAAGIQRLDLQGDLAPGVVFSRARWRGRELAVVTKAGGFGQPSSLFDAWRQLTATPQL
ncbi:four-carbon acid sugar kinase family protein [Pseudomonas gingeri]|uniref:Four-carbon acid sugar kinase family protein n=1 Tax=Pseudomonas gingeri TaxID=117681 RepID=A0A7Y7WX87_9PSED|nr:four-carbon acid sugar kinase family protein [Pseudomonas gingeri]NWB89390.1 four-carbon acid sugar kinase family protein [Pseudomonas gingeri]